MRKHYNPQLVNQAITALKKGGVIAYPTEAVYGLGCNPFNQTAVETLLSLKQRPSSQGLILIAANYAQIAPLIIPDKKLLWDEIHDSWPGPVTWVFPASTIAPEWITGKYNSIALRVTDHPIAKVLCEAFNNPIVSTSANITGQMPAKTSPQVQDYFRRAIECIVEGDCGNSMRPSIIRDALTGQNLRN